MEARERFGHSLAALFTGRPFASIPVLAFCASLLIHGAVLAVGWGWIHTAQPLPTPLAKRTIRLTLVSELQAPQEVLAETPISEKTLVEPAFEHRDLALAHQPAAKPSRPDEAGPVKEPVSQPVRVIEATVSPSANPDALPQKPIVLRQALESTPALTTPRQTKASDANLAQPVLTMGLAVSPETAPVPAASIAGVSANGLRIVDGLATEHSRRPATDGGGKELGATRQGVADWKQPRYRKKTAPAYPASSLRRREEGLVVLNLAVDAAGRPTEITVKQSSGSRALDEAAVKAVRKWEFEPARAGGRGVATEAEVPIRFKLEE